MANLRGTEAGFVGEPGRMEAVSVEYPEVRGMFNQAMSGTGGMEAPPDPRLQGVAGQIVDTPVEPMPDWAKRTLAISGSISNGFSKTFAGVDAFDLPPDVKASVDTPVGNLTSWGDAVGSTAGVVAAGMLGGAAGLSAPTLLKALTMGPVATRAAGRLASGEDTWETAKQATVESTMIPLAKFGFGVLRKGSELALANRFTTSVVNKMAGAINKILDGQVVKPEKLIGRGAQAVLADVAGAAGVGSLMYSQGMNAGDMVPYILLSTNNPISNSIMQSMEVSIAQRTVDGKINESTKKLIDVYDKIKDNQELLRKYIASDPDAAVKMTDVLNAVVQQGIGPGKMRVPEYGARRIEVSADILRDPKKFFPGLSNDDLPAFKQVMSELVDLNLMKMGRVVDQMGAGVSPQVVGRLRGAANEAMLAGVEYGALGPSMMGQNVARPVKAGPGVGGEGFDVPMPRASVPRGTGDYYMQRANQIARGVDDIRQDFVEFEQWQASRLPTIEPSAYEMGAMKQPQEQFNVAEFAAKLRRGRSPGPEQQAEADRLKGLVRALPGSYKRGVE